MLLQLTNRAKADLLEIAQYTEEKWGPTQRNAYISQIDEAFLSVTENYRLGVACDYIREGYFKFFVGKHVLYYRLIDTSIVQIVRILHGSMDVEQNL